MAEVDIEVLENGPFIVSVPVNITNYDGNPVEIPAGRSTVALCRCGASESKPFCDGAHNKVGFRGAKVVDEAK